MTLNTTANWDNHRYVWPILKKLQFCGAKAHKFEFNYFGPQPYLFNFTQYLLSRKDEVIKLKFIER